MRDSDLPLVAIARDKLSRKETLTARERAAWTRFTKDVEEKKRWEYYRSVPKKHYSAMSQRQQKVLNEQAERYDLPIGEAVVDLPKVIERFHDILAEAARKGINLGDPGDHLMSGESTEALERYRHWKANIAELDFREKKRQLVDYGQVEYLLTRAAIHYRNACSQLERRFGSDAADILRAAIEESRKLVDRVNHEDRTGDGGAMESTLHHSDGAEAKGNGSMG